MSSRRNRSLIIDAGFLAGVAAIVRSTSRGRNLAWAGYTRLMGRATIADRVAEHGPRAHDTWHALCNAHNMKYPPARITLLAFKEQRVLEVYAKPHVDSEEWLWLNGYQILGASGSPGPKLKEGDSQVPEGIYQVESLNPNSRFHLSMKLDYPNESDLARARTDGRSDLGGDIMIHGGTASIGCLAMGDPEIEELFVLAADVGIENIDVVIVPRDFRWKDAAGLPTTPVWTADLYAELREKLEAYPLLF